MICVASSLAGQGLNYNYVAINDRPQYNCSIDSLIQAIMQCQDFSFLTLLIALLLQGEWYSRETNLDTVTIIDATHMQRRGTCLASETDNAGNYTFLFGENPENAASCFHCVRIFVRTVNIIEKIESKPLEKSCKSTWTVVLDLGLVLQPGA